MAESTVGSIQEPFDLGATIEDLVWLQYGDSSEGSRWKLRWEFALWCLGHNLDIVATILTMSGLSWQKGFDAGLAIADLAPANPIPSSRFMALGQDPTD